MNLRDSIIQVLSDKKAKRDGLHVKHIARHIYNSSNNLFSDSSETNYERLKKRVTRILTNDVKKKKKRLFSKVKNPKNEKFRRGVYKLK